MSPILKKPRRFRFAMTPERTLAIGAMAILGIGFAQPAVMTMAGLSFTDTRFASSKIDPTPTGSVAPAGAQSLSHAEKFVHGLTGVIKRLRDRD